MKRIVASLGVAALGAACIQSSNAQGASGDPSKSWSVSVALRGFYDDNVNTSGVSSNKIDTLGFEVSPTLSYALPLDQTTLSLAYTFSYLYYDKQPDPTSGHDSLTHTVAARLLHAFSERTTLSLSDSFVIGQEPDVIRAGPFYAGFQRISGQNMRNFANLTVNHQISPKLGLEFGYGNALYDYEDNAGDYPPPALADNNPTDGFPDGVNFISRSAALDRMEHSAHIDARWTLQSTTIALVGYQFSLGRFTGDEPTQVIIAPNPTNNEVLYSDSRNYQAHYAYVGVEHNFRPDLFGSAKVGARFNELVNSPLNESSVSPYAAASLRYNYARDCDLEAGVYHDRNATDAFSSAGNSITSDTESTVAYASVTHRILPELFGTLMGQFQNSTWIGGSLDGTSEQLFLMSANLEYRFSRHVSANLSYHFDHLDSSLLTRGYDRNRIFLGATLAY